MYRKVHSTVSISLKVMSGNELYNLFIITCRNLFSMEDNAVISVQGESHNPILNKEVRSKLLSNMVCAKHLYSGMYILH